MTECDWCKEPAVWQYVDERGRAVFCEVHHDSVVAQVPTAQWRRLGQPTESITEGDVWGSDSPADDAADD